MKLTLPPSSQNKQVRSHIGVQITSTTIPSYPYADQQAFSPTNILHEP